MRHNPCYCFIIILFLFLFSHYLPLYWPWKNVYQATLLQSQNTFTQLLSKVFLNKYNKTFSCVITWSIMTKCIMKKNWTCSAAALELTLASCYRRQFTLNHHQVFVIISFCDHMWSLVVYCCQNMLFIAFFIAVQMRILDVGYIF